jgi:FtsH-binding integral membrane protein
MNRALAVTTGLVICALLGALNVIASLVGVTAESAPPLGIVITGGVLGLITLVAVAPAWRGSRRGLMLVMASRGAAALLAAPALFVDPSDRVRVIVAIAIAVTLAGISLLAATLRRTPARASR